MGDYSIEGNAKHDRKSALEYVGNKFEERKKTEAHYGRKAVLTDIVVDEMVTITHGIESRSFRATLEYDLLEDGKKVIKTDRNYVQGVECKTQKAAVLSLDKAILAKSKKLNVRLERSDKYAIRENVTAKKFVAYCFCERIYANEAERKNAAVMNLDAVLDENSREVDSWPEWKRNGL
ncbi:hypothetical protein HY485_00395 [Candidatus Woesearchaeota archaeon]|nr:hypothetical protein [Candidatus Woesearchaeota archaeon]